MRERTLLRCTLPFRPVRTLSAHGARRGGRNWIPAPVWRRLPDYLGAGKMPVVHRHGEATPGPVERAHGIAADGVRLTRSGTLRILVLLGDKMEQVSYRLVAPYRRIRYD